MYTYFRTKWKKKTKICFSKSKNTFLEPHLLWIDPKIGTYHLHLSYPQSFVAKSPTPNFWKFDSRQKDFQQNRQDSCGVSIEWTRRRRPDLIYVSTFKIVKVEIQNLLLPSTRWEWLEWHQLHLAWLSVYKGELSKYLKN